MGSIVTNVGSDRDEYHYDDESQDLSALPAIVAVLGGLSVFAYILNNNFYNNKDMGAGRILNDHIRQYFHKLEKNKVQQLAEKSPYTQRMYRTHNIAYPDVLYENLPYKQQKPDNAYINYPMPPSDATLLELTYGEPSNVITDNVMYEDGTPDLKEDYRLTKTLGRGPAGNTVITTEYAPGLSEKIRRDNPVVVSKPVVTPSGKVVRKVGRLAPVEIKSRAGRRFNKDYDEFGNPLQKEKPVYDTMDYLSDLKLTNEDYGEGQAGSRISNDSLKVYEDFIVKGKLREGWEVIPSED